MKNILKSIFFKLSYNQKLRKIAIKIFVYFPSLKVKLKELRDNSFSPANIEKIKYDSDFLKIIKKEIETKKKVNN